MKLEATAGKINYIARWFSVSTHTIDKPTWYRICLYIPAYAVCGTVTIQFNWHNTREGIFSGLFKGTWNSPELQINYKDVRVNKIRTVRYEYDPVQKGYIGVLLDHINVSEAFQINTELFCITNDIAHSGEVAADIPEGYAPAEYDII